MMADVGHFLVVVPRQARDAFTAPEHLAGVGQAQAGQDAQQAGLATAVGAGDNQHLLAVRRIAINPFF